MRRQARLHSAVCREFPVCAGGRAAADCDPALLWRGCDGARGQYWGGGAATVHRAREVRPIDSPSNVTQCCVALSTLVVN